MQTTSIKQKKWPAHPGPGRPVGFKTQSTIKKIAIKTLQDIMQNESASPEARAIAASKLIDEVKA
jgi:hypothetical protein